MTVRELQPSDKTKIAAMFAESGFAYDFPALDGPLVEAVLVVADESDEPIMACAAERICQLYLWCGKGMPAMKLEAIAALHSQMATVLKTKGYNEVNAFLPPQVEKGFGRRLERTFGWVRNWTSWARRF